jgi:HTH-type transcriptional regulator, global nitrogen regulator NrpRI
MQDRIERKRLTILKLLADGDDVLSSGEITRRLVTQGHDISERTVRFHLLALDGDGFTEYVGKKGRRLTEKGRLELSKARVFEKVGFLTSKIDQLTYLMKFDRRTRQGSVVVNVSMLERRHLARSCPLMARVFEAGYAMGTLVTLFAPGERAGDLVVPEDCVGIGTVCSITLNGILLAEGIPTKSRFGGLLEMQGGRPTRFVAISNYDGTSLDPLEIFIRSGMTDYTGATESGDGLIGASFREVPAASRDLVAAVAEELKGIGLGAVMSVGWPGQPLLGIPVDEGMAGALVIGGLNPVAILEEAGIRVFSRALSGLVAFGRLFPYTELEKRAAGFCQ